jgi:hypothetical protein
MGIERGRKHYLCVRYTKIHQYRGGSQIGRWVANTETPVCECERGARGRESCGLARAMCNHTLQPLTPAGQARLRYHYCRWSSVLGKYDVFVG